MKRALPALAQQLPALRSNHIQRLIDAGIRDRKHVEDKIRGLPDGGLILSRFLEISEQELIAAMGWTGWPEHTGVTLSSPCPLGVLAPTDDIIKDAQPSSVSVHAKELPAHHSLLANYGPPVSQGSVGTCPSFVAVAIIEGQQTSPIDLSERMNYSRTKAIDGHPDTDGSYLRFSTRALTEDGVCREATCPYVEDREALRQRPSDEAFEEATAYRPPSPPIRITPTDTKAICGEIAAGHPVGISVPLFNSSMYSLGFHNEGRITMKLGFLDRVAGYHAMCAAAYLDNTYLTQHDFPEELGGGAFLVRNSWGTTWARNNPLAKFLGSNAGYAIVPFGYVQEYCFEAYTAVVNSRVQRRTNRQFGEGIRAFGATWWSRTRNEVVTHARNRLAELKQ